MACGDADCGCVGAVVGAAGKDAGEVGRYPGS